MLYFAKMKTNNIPPSGSLFWTKPSAKRRAASSCQQ